MGRLGIAGRCTLPDAAAGLILTLAVAGLLVLVGAPVATSDFWFHAKIGETYASEGPWPDAEPLLHTAHADAPVQHEWLFGVGVYALDTAVGLQGVRVAHVLAVAAILLLVASLFYRESGSRAVAFALTLIFIALAWRRLIQFRPDLVSIPAAFLLYRLLLESAERPSWRRVAIVCGISLVWANAHSLFAIGPALLVAALLGVALQAVLSRWLKPSPAGPPPVASRPDAPSGLRLDALADWGSLPAGDSPARSDPQLARAGPLAARLAAALVLICIVTLLNPRGVAQHLTFFTSSSDFAIWAIADEWTPFTPFDYAALGRGTMTSWLAWLLADAIMLGWFVAAVWGGGRFLLRRSAESLRRVDPVLLGLGLSGVVAVLVSVRFLWMLTFTLLFLLRVFAAEGEQRAARTVQRRVQDWLAVIAAAALVVALPVHGGVMERVARLPVGVGAYLEQAWSPVGVHDPGVRFLAQTQLEGRLYNRYTMGGYLAYRLAPRLRTFIDGRTEHYPPDVLSDYFHIANRAEVNPGETTLEALDRRGVDIYFGVGMPVAGAHYYTTTALERAPGWRLIFRTPGQAIYLRANERNRANLQRVAEYYAKAGVPFDVLQGLDPNRVVQESLDWAIDFGALPAATSAWQRDRSSEDPAIRYAALNSLGRIYALFGAYAEQLAMDREASDLMPRELEPRRRLVFGQLHQEQPGQALKAARGLLLMSRKDPWAETLLAVAREYSTQHKARQQPKFDGARDRYVQRRRAAETGGPRQREEGWLVPVEAIFLRLPIFRAAEMRQCCSEFN